MLDAILLFYLASSSQKSTPFQKPAVVEVPDKRDELLEKKDYIALRNLFDEPRDVNNQNEVKLILSNLDWQKNKISNGTSASISFMYAQKLYQYSESIKPALLATEIDTMQKNALMIALYTYGAIQIDGLRCVDRSAPNKLLERTTSNLSEIFLFGKSLSNSEKSDIADLAIALDKRTSQKRKQTGDNDFVCKGGLDEMRYNLANGTAKEIPTPSGGFGRTIELGGDGKYIPPIRPEKEWLLDADNAREDLFFTFAKLINIPVEIIDEPPK